MDNNLKDYSFVLTNNYENKKKKFLNLSLVSIYLVLLVVSLFIV